MNGKFVSKSQLPVGKEEHDQRYFSTCGKFYIAYNECLKDMVGDVISCKMFRKRLQRCELQKGYYEEIKAFLKIPKTPETKIKE